MKILSCRRSLVAIIGIASLVAVAIINKEQVSMAISAIVAAVAGANAYEKRPQK